MGSASIKGNRKLTLLESNQDPAWRECFYCLGFSFRTFDLSTCLANLEVTEARIRESLGCRNPASEPVEFDHRIPRRQFSGELGSYSSQLLDGHLEAERFTSIWDWRHDSLCNFELTAWVMSLPIAVSDKYFV